MRILRLFVILTALTFATTTTAQSVAVSQMQPARTVTLKLQNVTLKEALNAISQQSGVIVAIADEALVSRARVSVSISDAAPIDAVKAALRGTQFTVKSSGDGKLLVLPLQQGARKASGVITGRVTDVKTGKGVAGANVSLGNDSRGVVSGEDGSYRLVGVSVGTHTVTVRLVGYAKQTRVVTVGEGATVLVDFRIEPSASVLDQVVVTGTVIASELRSVPNAITVITAKQIEERGITRIDQLFRGDIPGLFSAETGTDSELDEVVLYSRGATQVSGNQTTASFGTNPIKTYVDGVELADAQYLSQIDPKSIERIEILSGPQASTIYGAGAINGVMQIFTKRGSTARPSITLSLFEGFAQNNFSPALASSHQYDGSVSGIEGNFSYNIGSSWNYTGAWSPGKQVQRTSVYGGNRYQSGSFSLDLSARQGWTRNKVRGSTLQMNTGLAEDGVYSSIDGIVTPYKRSLYGRTFGLTIAYNPLSWWSHQVNIGRDDSDTEQLGLGLGFSSQGDTSANVNRQEPNMKTSQSYSSTLRASIASFAQATLTYGADHWRNRSSRITWTMAGQSLTNPGARRNVSGKNSGAYVQSQFGLWDALFFTYGVRADWNPNYGEQAKVRPGRYGVSYSRDFGVVSAKVRGSYGRSIRPPDDNQIEGLLSINTSQIDAFGSPLYTILPSPELGPEFQEGGEGGIELYLANRGSLVITRYNQTVDGLIRQVPQVDSIRANQPGIITNICGATSVRDDGYCYFAQPQNLNVGSIRNQGWEVQGSVNTGPLTTRGTYTWTKSRVIGVTPRYRGLLTDSEFAPGRPFSFLPEHTWAVNMSYARTKTSISLNLNGISSILLPTNGDLDLLTSSRLRLRVKDAPRMTIPGVYRETNSGYVIANINASHRVSSKVESILQVTNLANFYQSDVNLEKPTLGRQTRIGMRWRL